MSGRTLVFVDAARATVTRGAAGLVLEVDGVRTEGLVPRRAYPWSAPGRLVALLDAKEETVAMFEDLARLDEASRRILEDELAERRFLPRIEVLDALTYSRNLYEWAVRTDRGPRTFRTSHGWGEEPVRRAEAGVVLITATDGVRYRLDVARLSAREQALLETVI